MEASDATSTPPKRRPGPMGDSRVRLGAVIAIALAVGFLAWLLLRGDGESLERGDAMGPVEVSNAELARMAGESETPVFWAGPDPARKLELTKTSSGRVYVRYLPEAVAIGDDRADFLTIATYPNRNGYAAIRAAGAEGEDATETRIPGGGLMVSGGSDSKSAHFSYPGANYQVEAYAPVGGRAARLVRAGKVQRVR